MADRMELNEQELDSVVGGAFYYNTYTNEDGSEYMTCRVDDFGTYYCSDNAKKKIVTYAMKKGVANVTVEELIQYALDNGYFWN